MTTTGPARPLIAALLATLALGVSACGSGDDTAADRSAGDASSVPTPAPVAATSDDACAAFEASGGKGQPDEQTASADNVSMQKDFPVGADTGIRLVGQGRCGESWIISVGVEASDVALPPTAPKGTPVLVYLQSEFTPLPAP